MNGKHTSSWVDIDPGDDPPAARPRPVGRRGGRRRRHAGHHRRAAARPRRARSVALLEAGRVAGGVTAYTTAKVSSVARPPLRRGRVELRRGRRALVRAGERGRARADGRLGRRARDRLRLAPQAGVRLLDRPGGAAGDREGGRRRARAPACPVSLVTAAPELPFPVVAAIRYDDQAEFHPRKYLLGAARRGRPATAARSSSAPARWRAATARRATRDDRRGLHRRGRRRGRRHPLPVHGPRPVLRPHAPGALLRDGRLRRRRPGRGHVPVDGEPGAHDALDPHRARRDAAGRRRVAQGRAGRRGRALREASRRWAREHWNVREVAYRWATQDCMPVDGVPYIGKLNPGAKSLWVGDRHPQVGPDERDRRGGRSWPSGSPAASHPTRPSSTRLALGPLASAKELVKENVNVGRRFVQDHVARPDERSAGRPRARRGRHGARRRRARSAPTATRTAPLHAVSPVCTHLGCSTCWNGAEKSWDCPCHGSRFHWDGTVLEGPAVKDLPSVTLARGLSQTNRVAEARPSPGASTYTGALDGGTRMKVGLVLGAGGVMGGAWLTGGLHAIATRDRLGSADRRPDRRHERGVDDRLRCSPPACRRGSWSPTRRVRASTGSLDVNGRPPPRPTAAPARLFRPHAGPAVDRARLVADDRQRLEPRRARTGRPRSWPAGCRAG